MHWDHCNGLLFQTHAPKAAIDDRLPAGYRAASTLALGADGFVDLLALKCDLIRLPDGQLLADVAFAMTSTDLVQANGQETTHGANLYAFEVFVDEGATAGLAAFLASYGWPVHHATISLDGKTVQLSTDDGISYGLTADPALPAGQPAPSSVASVTDRYHHMADEGAYMDFGDDGALRTEEWVGALSATGGFLGDLPLTSSGIPIAGTAWSTGWGGDIPVRRYSETPDNFPTSLLEDVATGEEPHTLYLYACTGGDYVLPFDAPTVDEALPPGFVSGYSTWDVLGVNDVTVPKGAARIQLMAIECNVYLHGANAGRIGLAWTATALSQAEGRPAASYPDSEFYDFEFFLDSDVPAIEDLLTASGWTPLAATIEADTAGISVAVAGQVLYRATMVADSTLIGNAWVLGSETHLSVTEAKTLARTIQVTFSTAGPLSPGTVETLGGELGRLRPGPDDAPTSVYMHPIPGSYRRLNLERDP